MQFFLIKKWLLCHCQVNYPPNADFFLLLGFGTLVSCHRWKRKIVASFTFYALIKSINAIAQFYETLSFNIFILLWSNKKTSLNSSIHYQLSTCFHQFYFTKVFIEIKNNKARHNLSNLKYRQMAFRLVDGTVVGSFVEPLGQTKEMHSHQREITWSLFWFSKLRKKPSWTNDSRKIYWFF